MKSYSIKEKFMIYIVFVYELVGCSMQTTIVLHVGTTNKTNSDFALELSDYKKFLENDFGYAYRCTDNYYII